MKAKSVQLLTDSAHAGFRLLSVRQKDMPAFATDHEKIRMDPGYYDIYWRCESAVRPTKFGHLNIRLVFGEVFVLTTAENLAVVNGDPAISRSEIIDFDAPGNASIEINLRYKQPIGR